MVLFQFKMQSNSGNVVFIKKQKGSMHIRLLQVIILQIYVNIKWECTNENAQMYIVIVVISSIFIANTLSEIDHEQDKYVYSYVVHQYVIYRIYLAIYGRQQTSQYSELYSVRVSRGSRSKSFFPFSFLFSLSLSLSLLIQFNFISFYFLKNS